MGNTKSQGKGQMPLASMPPPHPKDTVHEVDTEDLLMDTDYNTNDSVELPTDSEPDKMAEDASVSDNNDQ